MHIQLVNQEAVNSPLIVTQNTKLKVVTSDVDWVDVYKFLEHKSNGGRTNESREI